jgi:ribonuclease P protein component
MLPKENRLKNRDDFQQVYKMGKFASADGISMKFAKNNLEITRIGFSIESKYFKTAIKRNRIRRILREVFRKNIEKIKSGFDIVVFYKRKEDKIDFSIISVEAEKMLRKVNIIN